jgi:hypothetical protein
MRRFFIYLIILFTLSAFRSSRQSSQVVRGKVDFFAVDNLGNIYIVHGDELQKFLPNGKFFARYSNLRLGSITGIDVTNPLKILLYYRDFQQIVFLDNQLSVNSEPVSLEKLGYEQTWLACASANNSFWIYNRQNNELLRFNEQSKRVAATGNLRQVLHPGIAPEFMTESNGYLYLSSPGTGIYVFDMFGTFSKLLSLKDIRRFQVSGDVIYFTRDSLLCSYDHRLFEEGCRPVPRAAGSTAMVLGKDKIFVGFRDSVISVPHP